MITSNTQTAGNVQKSSSKARGASKKLYFARNANFAITNKNRDRRLARVARRAAYWASAAGEARKNAKWNTNEKIEKREAALKARDARRRLRRDEENKAANSIR